MGIWGSNGRLMKQKYWLDVILALAGSKSLAFVCYSGFYDTESIIVIG